MFAATRLTRSAIVASIVGSANLLFSQGASAALVSLQQATAQATQGGFNVASVINNVYPTNDAGGVGWADDIGGTTPSNIAVFETTTDLALSAPSNTLRFNLFAGGFSNHTVGSYRISYTSDDRSTFANGLDNGGAVAANWIPIVPTTAISGGGATLTILPDGRILASGTNPNLSTDTLYASFPFQTPAITGFRIEAIEDASLPNNGPGRPGNGNFVLREFDPAVFAGNRVTLQNGTAQVSQGGFSVDNMLNGDFDFTSAGGEGWANNAAANNIATFETTADIVGSHLITAEIMSGGFGVHTLGRFRLSVTDADRSNFADGNDNGGAGVGNETIWTVINIDSITSDGAGTTFTGLFRFSARGIRSRHDRALPTSSGRLWALARSSAPNRGEAPLLRLSVHAAITLAQRGRSRRGTGPVFRHPSSGGAA